jgi:hypothetical protein
METIAKAKTIEQFFIFQNREYVENFNILLRNSTGVHIADCSKPGGELETKDTEILTSRVRNSPLA